MPTRDQLTQERLNSLIMTLGEAGVLGPEECRELCGTRGFGEAEDVRENAPDSAVVTRVKVSEKTKSRLEDAVEEIDDDAAANAVRELAHVVTGDDRFEE